MRQGEIILIFTSPLTPDNEQHASHHKRHGDAVRDIALRVKDCRIVYEAALRAGAISVMAPCEEHDQFGVIVRAAVLAVDDTIHSLV